MIQAGLESPMGARSGQCGHMEGPCRLLRGLGSHAQGQGGHYCDLPEVPMLSLCDAVLTFIQVGVAPRSDAALLAKEAVELLSP